MAIFIPEKIIQASLVQGLTTVKADLDLYLSDIFDSDLMGQEYVDTVKEYLTGNKVKISQGYPLNDLRIPGWFVVPASIQPSEEFIGNYATDEDIEAGDTDAEEINAKLNSFSIRVLTASSNGDVSLFLDAVARYILLLAKEELSEYNLNEMELSTLDWDPIYQYLPDTLYYRSTIVNCRAMDTWIKRVPLIKSAHLYVTFNLNETFQEV